MEGPYLQQIPNCVHPPVQCSLMQTGSVSTRQFPVHIKAVLHKQSDHLIVSVFGCQQ